MMITYKTCRNSFLVQLDANVWLTNPVSMQNGDKVVYSKFAGTDLKVADDDFVILKVGADWNKVCSDMKL